MASPENAEAEASDPSYIDYELFLDPSFSAPSFANTLVLATNNPTDSPLDLSTPLSRVLFDIQEVDSHIHTLTSASALPLLTHTESRTHASAHLATTLSAHLASLNASYTRLATEVIARHAAAAQVHLVAARLAHTVRLARSVGRALQLGRQLEVQMAEQQAPRSTTAPARDDHRAMVRAASTILTARALFAAAGPGEEGEHLASVHAVAALQRELVQPAERALLARAQQLVRDFSLSTLSGGGAATYAQTEAVKSRTASALQTLYLLSPAPPPGTKHAAADRMVAAVQEHLRAAVATSLAALVRAIGILRTLDDALLQVAARCQDVVALELLLASTAPPPAPQPNQPSQPHPTTPPHNLLGPVLAAVDTPRLASYFWRTLAAGLAPRVQELVRGGGTPARALKTNRDAVRDMLREAVLRGCRAPSGAGKLRDERGGEWEREAAVMVGAVVGHLGR